MCFQNITTIYNINKSDDDLRDDSFSRGRYRFPKILYKTMRDIRHYKRAFQS